MAPKKMEGFGSDGFQQLDGASYGGGGGYVGGGGGLGGGGYTNVHNKPAPTSFWHAASRFASTVADVAKPATAENKKGFSLGDIGRAAWDMGSMVSGDCRYTGGLKSVEERMRCDCAGCKSWDNGSILREKQAREAKEAEVLAGKKAGAYKPPSMDVPGTQKQEERTGPWGPARCEPEKEPETRRTGPWGPAQTEQNNTSGFGFVSAAAAVPVAAEAPDLLDVGPAAQSTTQSQCDDLLGFNEEPAACNADLVGSAFNDEKGLQQSNDVNNMLMSHAAKEADDDLIGLF